MMSFFSPTMAVCADQVCCHHIPAGEYVGSCEIVLMTRPTEFGEALSDFPTVTSTITGASTGGQCMGMLD